MLRQGMNEGFKAEQRPIFRMLNLLSLGGKGRSFRFLAGMIAIICTALLMMNLASGQDYSQAPPMEQVPPPDNQGPPSQEQAPPDNSQAPPPDSENGGDDSGASFQTFYDSLQNQGNWIQSSDYGYVWQPQVNDPDWAPYTDGHWVYTDDGWTWVSDEPWGWATYHYGRWVNIDGTGWCWVPGYTWAPAWVSWRYGGGYCGWAPLPPDSFVGIDYGDGGFAIGIGFHIGGDCDNFYGIGAGCYHFVPSNCLGYHNYHHYYCNPHDNYAIINHTTNVTNINVNRHGGNYAGGGGPGWQGGHFHHVTTGGPSLAQVNAVSQTPVPRVNLIRSNQPGGGGSLGDRSLTLYAPHFNPATRETSHPGNVAGTIGQANINRGTDITRPLAVNPRLTATPPSEAQIQQAHLSQSQAPANAKVATANTPVNPVLQTPLTTLKPIQEQSPRAGSYSGYHTTTPQSQGAISPNGYHGGGGSPPVYYHSGPVYPSNPSSTPPHSSPPGAAPYHPPVSTGGVPASGSHPTSGGNSSGGGNSYHGGGGSSGSYHGGGSSGGNSGGGSSGGQRTQGH